MKLYAVTTGDYSDYDVVAIFSSEKKAIDFCDLIRKTGPRIKEYLLDPRQDEIRLGLKPYYVSITDDHEDVKWERGSQRASVTDQLDRGDTYVYDTFETVVWARDEAHALKIGGERRAQYIVEHNLAI